ncbi:hypothetical protein EOA13_34030 [Mesorhizobium sp. M7A.F.Ca.US.011.01.1.1]|nr:hypothetical protein EOA13_34030 [Mesorhizobium sp. M7A.F.Ca.US.011.01.1.1]
MLFTAAASFGEQQQIGDVGKSELPVRLGPRMVKGLANYDGVAIIAARADEPFASVDDLSS